MDRLRRSLRESFRRKKDHVPESSKPHQWQSDEIAVRSGTCVFPVKYLGCVEVFESRGMQVCEEALKVLRNSRRRPIKGTLFVTGDGLRVVDDETKGLIVDQTIEKVSFCAPDRSHERGFSYICRDGTTRRWMCHGFHANKDSGERLSHAVGCAFAVCLERKQKRDKEAVTMNFDPKTSSFVRTGSFRQTSITERLQDPQVAKPSEPPPVKPVHNPYAVERPHATPNLLQRQGSLRGGPLNTASPFKRQLSLRINDLPSNMERQRSHSVDVTLSSFPKANTNASTIPETSPNDQTDTITSMCQQLARGLKMLSSVDDPFYNVDDDCKNDNKNQQTNNTQSALSFNDQLKNKINTSNVFPSDSINWTEIKSISTTTNTTMNNKNTNTNSHPKLQLGNKSNSIMTTSSAVPIAAPRYNNPNFSQLRSQSLGSADAFFESKSNINTSVNWPNSQQNNDANLSIDQSSVWTNDSSAYQTNNACPVTTAPTIPAPSDPFDSEWVALASRHHQDNFRSTNPFTQSSAPVKAFEVHM